MNTPETTSPIDPTQPPLPVEPPFSSDFGSILDALLKRPAQLIGALHAARQTKATVILAVTALLSFAAYGLVIGSFSSGMQLYAAPLKVALGSTAGVLICLPSLFIFTCLSGANVTLRSLVGVMAAVLALTAILLIGFAPVSWVFSQSTESVAFMGTLHLAFWLIALGFGLRLIGLMMKMMGVESKSHLKVWTVIFVLVNLQMSTALRPIVGTSTDILPQEKKFFVAHWFDSLGGKRTR